MLFKSKPCPACSLTPSIIDTMTIDDFETALYGLLFAASFAGVSREDVIQCLDDLSSHIKSVIREQAGQR